jgi:hypothetical protein
MIIARAMMEGDLQAMDRWIMLMGELDRYHGFAAAQILGAADGAAPPRLAGPERRSISPNPALGEAEGKFSASQTLEIPRNAEGISDSALLERLAAPERRPIPPNPARGRTEAFRSPASRRERLTANGVARKWRRNGLKRLNPRREMVWALKPRTYKM